MSLSARILPPLLLFFGAFAVSWLFQSSPSLGDDLNYWGLAFDLHQGVEGAWRETSFHDLRWPVWGLIWLLQIPFGFGALGYYLQPMVYLGAGAVLVYFLAREVGLKTIAAFTAGLLFLYHPQLDSVIDRPMPDLSEGFWVALAFFCWLRLMNSRAAGPSVALAACVGLALAVGQANRITGAFAVPVLFLGTVLFFRHRFLWLVVAGMFAAGFVFVEMAFYHHLTGDWFHALNTNQRATGRKGTGEIPLWELPIRFIPAFYRRHTDVIFGVLALAGVASAFLFRGRNAKATATYAIVYLMTYSCAVQSLNPLRPLIRDGERFLASLAFPLAVLAALGLTEIVTRTRPCLQRIPPVGWLVGHPRAALLLLVFLLTAITTRPFRGPNYLDEIATYLDQTPRGTRVLSHDAMRHVAYLANPDPASEIEWSLQHNLLRPDAAVLGEAREVDQIWFIRKWIWTGTRKQSEYDILDGIGDIAPYLRPPIDEWAPILTVAKGNVPDFVFLGRRSGGVLPTERLESGELIREFFVPDIPVPFTWELPGKTLPQLEFDPIPIPEELRGKTLFVALRYSSDITEPIRGGLEFYSNGKRILSLHLKPYFFPESSEDFFYFTIPESADSVVIRFRLSAPARRVSLDNFQIFVEQSKPGLPNPAIPALDLAPTKPDHSE